MMKNTGSHFGNGYTTESSEMIRSIISKRVNKQKGDNGKMESEITYLFIAWNLPKKIPPVIPKKTNNYGNWLSNSVSGQFIQNWAT